MPRDARIAPLSLAAHAVPTRCGTDSLASGLVARLRYSSEVGMPLKRTTRKESFALRAGARDPSRLGQVAQRRCRARTARARGRYDGLRA